MTRSRRQLSGGFAVLVAVLATPALASCSLVPGSGSCIDYIGLNSPAERFQAAPTVVLADISTTSRTIDVTGRYEIHRAHIASVLKGTVSDDEIDVINPSDQCTTSGQPVDYLEGDSLVQNGRRVLYLRKVDGRSHVWRLFVPNAADPPSVAASLPHRR